MPWDSVLKLFCGKKVLAGPINTTWDPLNNKNAESEKRKMRFPNPALVSGEVPTCLKLWWRWCYPDSQLMVYYFLKFTFCSMLVIVKLTTQPLKKLPNLRSWPIDYVVKETITQNLNFDIVKETITKTHLYI